MPIIQNLSVSNGFVVNATDKEGEQDSEIVNLILRKVGSQYVLYTHKKGPGGKRRRLGTFKSRAAALRRERQINFFKHRG